MKSATETNRIPYALLLLLAVFATSIGVAAYAYYTTQAGEVEREIRSALAVIAEQKAGQIASWRKERLADAQMLSASSMLVSPLLKVLTGDGRTKGDIETIQGWMASLKISYGYSDVVLVDAEGQVKLSVSGSPSLRERCISEIRDVMRGATANLTELHLEDPPDGIHISAVAPLREREGAPAVGAVVLRLDPGDFLYPFVQAWPTPSQTAETLLVRLEDNEVVFLNELRHRKNTALSLRLPIDDRQTPSVRAAFGLEGVSDGVDYRGVSVLAAVRQIPNSNWYLVAKEDAEEVYGPIRTQARLAALVTGLLIVAVAAIFGFLWRGQQSRLYRRYYEAEVRRRLLIGYYNYLSRYANDIILLKDDTGRIIEANEKAILTYGYSREELLQLNIRDLREPSALLDFQKQWDAMERPDGVRFETVHQRKDGTLLPVEVSARVIAIDDRKFRQSIIRDITERKRAELELNKSKEALERAQRIAQVGDWELDLRSLPERSSRRYRWSDEVYRILGVDPKNFQATGENFYACVHPDDRALVAAAFDKAVASGERYEIEHRIVRADGSVRYVRERAEILSGEDGRPRLAVGAIQDITDYRQLEEQLRQAQKLESVGRLAGGIAHDFNNLLTVINGYSQLALSRLDNKDRLYSQVSEIRKAGERAAELTQQLLAFSRRQVVQPRPLDINTIVAELETILRRVIGEDIELVSVLQPSLGAVMADASQIQQVLMNLAVNARDAMPGGGKLTIETADVDIDDQYVERHSEARPGLYVRLAISDTGSGMDEEVKSRIFDPFFTTKEIGKGTGLGLATVYGIVKQSEGWIAVYSEVGKGTTFKIHLPRIVETRTVDGSPAEAGSLAPQATATVLIVEDLEGVRRLASQVLGNHGYNVLTATGASEALQLCEHHQGRIDLMLTDVVMPGMTGQQLSYRAQMLRPEMKVLLMSGFANNALLHDGVLDAGIGFLQEPFTGEELARKVKMALTVP